MAAVVAGLNKIRELEDSFKPIVHKIIAEVPSTFTHASVSYPLELIIVSGRRSPEENEAVNGAKHSKHLYGLAFDFKLNLNGSPFSFPGRYPNYSRSSKAKIPGTNITIDAHDVFAIVGQVAIANGCTWGGNFKTYDPIHIQSSVTTLPSGVVIGNDDDIMVYENLFAVDASNTYKETAGEESKLVDASSNISTTKDTVLYIGYDLTLSDFSNIPFGSNPLRELLTSANVPEKTVNDLVQLNGLRGNPAYLKYKENPNISITNENAELILSSQISALVDYLSVNKGFDSSEYPTEISTAIVSYFFGKNMSTPENSTQLDEMFGILISSHDKANDLAGYIERKAVDLPSDIKARRLREAQLLRGYNPDKSNVIPSALTSTKNSADYENSSELLKLQLKNQKDEISKLFDSRSSSGNEPASSEYDDSFNDIDQSTLDAIAKIMQSQQVNSDIHFGLKESEYVYRIKTKNLYSILARKLNTSISNIEKLMQTEDLLKNYSEYTFTTMYSMVPYGNGLGYTVKRNAVKRCEYRIRLIERQIKNTEIELISLGVPSTVSYSEITGFLAATSLVIGAVAFAILLQSIKPLFTRLSVLRWQLKLEKGNLSSLKKDMNRYST